MCEAHSKVTKTKGDENGKWTKRKVATEKGRHFKLLKRMFWFPEHGTLEKGTLKYRSNVFSYLSPIFLYIEFMEDLYELMEDLSFSAGLFTQQTKL